MRDRDVITRAFRRIGVLAVDESVQAADEAYAREVLEGVFDEAKTTQGLKLTFGLDDIPARFVEGLALLLAADIAPTYSKQPPPRSLGLVRLRAAAWPVVKRITDPRYPTDYDFSAGESVEDTYF